MNINKLFLIGGLLLALLLGVEAGSVENIRIVWSESPQTAAGVVWDGDVADDTAVLLYDTVSRKDGEREYAFRTPVTETGLYAEGASKKKAPTEPSPDFFYHHAALKNLKPETVYYIAIKNAAGPGREYHFKTAPKGDKPFKFIYAGDSRSNVDIARAINDEISGMIAKDDSIVALLHGGDYALDTRRTVWKDWLEAYALTTTNDGKLLPIIPVIGNHEGYGDSPIFRQAYGNPGGTNDYYLVHLTPEAGIIVLNTEISAEGAQLAFLQKSLAELKADKIKWQIAAYHKPIFPAIKKPSEAKLWVPLFEEFNIDLALESDGHCIKRTVPIRDGKEAVDGIVYLGEGGYGAPQRDPKTDRWYIQGENAFASKGDHIMMLEITPDAIHYSTILKGGTIADAATFKPRR